MQSCKKLSILAKPICKYQNHFNTKREKFQQKTANFFKKIFIVTNY